MRKKFKFLIGAPALGIAAFVLVACGEEAQQSAGESADKAVEAMKQSTQEVKKKAGEAGEAIKEGYQKAKEKTAEMAHSAGEAMHEGTGKGEHGAPSEDEKATAE